MFEINLAELVPKAMRDAKMLIAGFPVEFFLGENPLSATLIIPGTADKTRKRFATLSYPKDIRAVRRAEQLYDAWLSFYRGEIREVQEAALRLFEDIEKNETPFPGTEKKTEEKPAYKQKLGASYLICSLSRYGMPQYHTDAAVAYMKELKESSLRSAQAAEIDLAMYEMSIGIMSDVPAWIKEGKLGVGRVGDRLLFSDGGVFPENIYAAMIAAIQYKNYHGEFMESITLIDTAEKSYGMRSVIIGDVYFALYRALNAEALGFYDEADAHLKQAVQLVKKDGLWQIISQFFTSFGNRFFGIVNEVDAEGAAQCRSLVEGFFDTIKSSHQEEKERRGYRDLSPQELKVTMLWAAGRRNKDIAEELHIGIPTVKFHKSNISKKLKISAHADAAEIRKALERYEISATWMSS